MTGPEPQQAASRVPPLPELCHSLIERSPIPMAELKGAHHIVRYGNAAFCRLVGKDRDALVGRPFSESVQEGDRCLDVLNRVYRTGISEMHCESEQTEPHPVYWSYAMWSVRDAQGGIVGVMIQVTETTSFHEQVTAMNQELLLSSVRQHERTEETVKLNDELDQRVSARTHALEQSEARLRLLATELNLAEQRERRRLATELHDYLAQLLAVGKMSLARIKQQTRGPLVEQLDETLDEALHYTRTLVAQLSPPMFYELGLPYAFKWLAEQMESHGLHVTVEVQDGVPSLSEDRATLVFQAARELLMNTLKHAGTDQARLAMTAVDGTVRIEVSDDGCGFDGTALDSVAARGTHGGFGLFSIRERMRAIGGAFHMVSRPGQGTRATLMAPIDQLETATIQGSEPRTELSGEPVSGHLSEVPPPAITPSSGESSTTIRVLLVDDHAIVRQGLRTSLDAYEDVTVVGEAGNGHEAVQLVDQLRPSVVVMDINMPRMNGIEATVAIKARHPTSVVIGLSVQADALSRSEMLRAGAAALVNKASAVEELYDVIQEAVN